MEIRLLSKDYKKNKNLYKDFLEGKIIENDEYLSEEFISIEKIPEFPIYMGSYGEKEKNEEFKKAFKIIENFYINISREYILEGRFWHSLFLIYKRDYLLEKYPKIKESEKDFRNIVIKKFDWENYIYKSILIVQYVTDNIKEQDRDRYYDIILENLDLFNYMIKYEIFRNDKFILNVLDIIDECKLSSIMKAKIKDRPDLGKDERYGRRVLFEFNKSYPVILSPMLEKEELKKYIYQYLSYYGINNL